MGSTTSESQNVMLYVCTSIIHTYRILTFYEVVVPFSTVQYRLFPVSCESHRKTCPLNHTLYIFRVAFVYTMSYGFDRLFSIISIRMWKKSTCRDRHLRPIRICYVGIRGAHV